MAKIYPFKALRPTHGIAPDVASVPYDVVNKQEARALAGDNAKSFLHVIKPEIDLGDDKDPYSDEVYEQGATTLRRFISEGILKQDDKACFYVYALTMGSHTQVGLVCLASIAEYDRNEVKKHEYTRPDKEDDRVRHMEILGAQTGTVFLVHRDSDALKELIEQITSQEAAVDFRSSDDIRHRFWVVDQDGLIEDIEKAFAQNGQLYIADGHHRSASASRVSKTRGKSEDGFLAVSFPSSQMKILPYNRVVKSLGDTSPEDFLSAVGERFDVKQGKWGQSVRHSFAMYLGGKWYTLTAKADSFDESDPVDCLDVSILQDSLLEPLLGIKDPRTAKGIAFVGGIRGDDELVRLVDGGDAVAFAMHATSIDELLNIADAEKVMPPKSTWFEPKLRDGLFVNLL